MKNSANLDILRASAVIAVFFCSHFLSLGFRDMLTFAAWGSSSVLDFLRAHESGFNDVYGADQGTGNFYVRRFFRIYPLSVLIIKIVTIFHIPPHACKTTLTVQHLQFVIEHLPDDESNLHACLGPLWSLPLEVRIFRSCR